MSESNDFAVVCYDSDPEWMDARRSLVTGSVAPHLLGVGRFGSLLGSYMRMRNVAQDDFTPEHRAIMDWGTDQQDAIVANIRRRLGLEAIRTGALLRSRHYPWMGCTLDGWVRTSPKRAPFEVKTTRSRDAAEAWDEGVPVDVVPQVQQQLLVTGAERALVAAVVFGAPPAFTWVERDEGMIGELIERSREFYERVERADPPPPSGSKDDTQHIEALVERQAGKSVELDIEAVVLAEDLATLEEQKKAIDRRIMEHKQKLIRKLGDAEIGRMPGGSGSVTYKSQVRKGYVKVGGGFVGADVREAMMAWAPNPAVHDIKDVPDSTFRVLRRAKG